MQWIGETMKEMKNRTDDISQFELSMTAVNFEMTVTRTTMDMMFETFSQMNTENQNRDRHIAEVLTQTKTDIRTRD